MAKLIWSSRALADLDAACEYISRDSPKYAYLFAQRIIAMIETIRQHPWLGAVVPEYRRESSENDSFRTTALCIAFVGTSRRS